MIWKRHWQRIGLSPADRPTRVGAAVKLCSKTEFPNVHVLLRIACTIPVTSYSAKEPPAACIGYRRSHERQWLRIASAVWHWFTFIRAGGRTRRTPRSAGGLTHAQGHHVA